MQQLIWKIHWKHSTNYLITQREEAKKHKDRKIESIKSEEQKE